MAPRACSLCWQAKKKCDRKRPCSRCKAFGHHCRNRELTGYSGRGPYTRRACSACALGKVRCGDTRPCDRCNRLGIDCEVLLPRTESMITPYQTGGYLPTPSMEDIYNKLNGFLETLSPFTLADLLCGTDISFRSSVSGVCSVIPRYRKRELLERMVTLAGLQVSQPEMVGFISNRVHSFLEPEQPTPIAVSQVTNGYNEFDSMDQRKALMEYYMHSHEFAKFPNENGCRPGVMVSTFIEPELVDGAYHGLIGTLNPEAEALTGYTSEEYHRFQNVITPDFSSFDDFPQVLRVYHRDDIFIVVLNGLLAFLSPGTEIHFEARVIHKNGHVIPARLANFATVKPDGKLELFITIAAPLP